MKDLIVLVPDKNTRYVIESLVNRKQAFGIRQIEHDIYIHPEHDPGIYHKSADFLRVFLTQYKYSLVFLDREGSGQENRSVDEIYSNIKVSLGKNGWENRSEVVVFNPELEIWGWVNSSHLVEILGWDDFSSLRDAIIKEGLWKANSIKPERPKETIEFALRKKRIPRSSAIYEEIAKTVSFRDCVEPSFIRFKEILTAWFSN